MDGTEGIGLLQTPEAEARESSARFLEALLWTVMGVVTFVGLAVTLLVAGAGWRTAASVVLADLAGVGLLLLNRSRRTLLATALLIALAWTVVVSRALLAGGLHSPVPSALILITVAAGLLLNYRWGSVTAVALCATALGIAGAELAGALHAPPGFVGPARLGITLVATVSGICAVQFVAIRAVRSARKRSQQRERLLESVLENLPVGVWFVDRTARLLHRNKSAQQIWGGGRLVGLDGYHEYKGRSVETGREIAPDEWASARAVFRGETTADEQIEIECFDGTRKTILNSAVPLRDERGEIAGAIIVNQDITRRQRAEESAREHLAALTALHAAAKVLTETMDSTQLAKDVTRACVEVFGATVAWLGIANPDGAVEPLAQFPPAPSARVPGAVRWRERKDDDGPTGTAVQTGAPAVAREAPTDGPPGVWQRWALGEGIQCAASFPLITRDRPFGSLTLYSRDRSYLTQERYDILQTYAHEVAAALTNARLHEETERNLMHTQALRKIDRAIGGSLDLRVTLDTILDQVRAALRVDAADVLLADRLAPTLAFAAGDGFAAPESARTTLRLGEDDAGRAALERRTVTGPEPTEEPHARWSALAAAEGFAWRAATPLVAKGEVKGVLEVFQRRWFKPDRSWLDFLEMLAGQAALAVDSAALFDDLQRSNLDLKLAYDATIEGWSRALELRDNETEGHSLRVTALAERLARAMGMNERDLVNLRRGALLHDIGKVAVPDSILFKDGPLTDEERETMQKHTTHALEILSPIRHLRPALDIPVAHHEWWDGSGYPRGRKGEQIPLAARIFAVVDVWDALTCDRPYRRAWSAAEVREHIRSHAGTQFDPDVVEAFLAFPLEEPAAPIAPDPATEPTPRPIPSP
ncbi:MAG TPA: HD domain-containing phosphohydrolase [Thermoanaerobaculaceae bacterium]|nr:HD domain-containing phosphohydrolase [Thermoanaerobaculaceae bacterium]